MNEKEAKAILRKRYEDKGYKVSRVTRLLHAGFSVSFPEGKGPKGLFNVHCNWPKEES